MGKIRLRKWLLVLILTLGLLDLACGSGGKKTTASPATPTETVSPVPLAIPRRRTPRPVATVPGGTPTVPASPTPPAGTEGTSWLIAALFAGKGDSNDLAFSSDGTKLAVASADQKVWLIDPVSGSILGALAGHGAPVNQVVFSPHGRWLLSGGDDGNLIRWDATSGALLANLGDSILGKVTGLALNAAGTQFASSSGVGVLKLWNADWGTVDFELVGHLTKVSGLSFSPDGSELASADLQGRIMLFPTDGTRSVALATDAGSVQDLAFVDSTHLAVAGSSGVRIWDLMSGARVALEPASSIGQVSRLAVSQDQALLAALDDSGTIWIWDLPSYRLQAVIPPGDSQPLSLAFSPVCYSCPTDPGWMMAIGGKDGKIWLWGIQERPPQN